MMRMPFPFSASRGRVSPTAGGGGGASAITSSVLASRTGGSGVSGAAPLYVHFDASGTTSSDSSITNATNGGAFRQITHAFDFGDTGAGTWTQSGLSRNAHSGGPITAHVFETPGTYTVNVTHSHAGTTDKAATPITITVTDPDTVYSGTNTVCIEGGSVTGTGGPSGCAYFSTLTAAGGISSNKRYLFKRGQSHSTNLGGSYSGVRVGAYGSGAKPIITGGFSVGGGSGNNAIRDCDVRGIAQFYSNHNLLWKCDASAPSGPVFFNVQEGDFNVCKYNCFAENVFDGGGSTNCAIYGTMAWVAFMGNSTTGCLQHDLRWPNAYKSCIQHNWLKGIGSDGIRHSIKVHAAGSGSSPSLWNESAAGLAYATEKIVISDNILGSTTSSNDWTCCSDPQNNTGSQVEAVQDIIVENNRFYRGTSGSPTDILMGGRRHTRRGNTSINATVLASTGVNSANIPSGWDGPYFSS